VSNRPRWHHVVGWFDAWQLPFRPAGDAIANGGNPTVQDLSQLSDPELIAERARVRDELERQGDRTNRDDLTRARDAVANELARRMGW
jgi:hypothetical protein